MPVPVNFDPVTKENNQITHEIEKLTLALAKENINLKHFISKVVPYVGVDISKGVVLPKENSKPKKPVMKGAVQRISVANKIQMKNMAIQRK